MIAELWNKNEKVGEMECPDPPPTDAFGIIKQEIERMEYDPSGKLLIHYSRPMYDVFRLELVSADNIARYEFNFRMEG